MRSKYKTPRWKIASKVAFITWLLCLVFGFPYLFLLAFANGNDLEAWTKALFYFTVIVFGTIYAFMFGMSLLLNTISWVVDRDPVSKELRRRGFDVYFDHLPSTINPDPMIVRGGGLPEPQTAFMPPDDWHWQCPACGARNPAQEGGACWHCGGELTQHGDWRYQCNCCKARNPAPHGNCWRCGSTLSNETGGNG